jgi:anaerobic magnesium-protoporphyrin IX monomethyl ester cyclase
MYEGSSPKLRVAIVIPAKKLLCLGGLLWMQRYGALQVASVVRNAGYAVRLFNEELGMRVSAERLAQEFDVVGFSCKSSALTRAEELAEVIKEEALELGREVITILGGEHISMGGDSRRSPHFDYALRGESEGAFVALLKALESEEHEAAKGFQTAPGDPCICRYFDNIPDLSLVSGYQATVRGFLFRHLPLLWTLKNRMLPMLTFQGTRGCPYNCSFCPTPRYLQGNDYRRRSVESALDYLKEHIALSGIRRVLFEDPTAALPFNKESHQFFEALAQSPVSMKATILVRADLYEDRKLLEVMKAAGVTNLSVGIESLSDRVRSDFKKKTSYDTIRKSLDTFHELGFSITGLFIVGYDTDDRDCFQRIHQFINETGIEKWKASPLTQMPEVSDQFLPAHRYFLWDEFKPFGRQMIDYGNGECVIFFPRHMKPSTLQKEMMEFNRSAASLRDLARLFGKRRNIDSLLGRVGNNLAQRMVQSEIAASHYFQMVEELEKPFYVECDGRVELQEMRLLRRYQERLKRDTGAHEPQSRLPFRSSRGAR